MRSYDPSKPLIFSHIPKTAGTSVRELFSQWYGENLLLHYKGKKKPPKYDLDNPPMPGKPVALYGHFNTQRGVGIDQYYPQVEQFVTILRDPLERVASAYFFKTQNEMMRKAYSWTARMTLEEYVDSWPGKFFWKYGTPTTNYLPGAKTGSDYKEIFDKSFVEVGVTEFLDISLSRIAEKLGFDFDASQLKRLNAVKRTSQVPDEVREKFMARNPLEYEIYNYVRERFV